MSEPDSEPNGRGAVRPTATEGDGPRALLAGDPPNRGEERRLDLGRARSSRRVASFALRAAFTWAEERTKRATFGCRMCGQCALPLTGYACPMTCPKQLRNGPCGGVGADGGCEVYPDQRCVWVQAYERASSRAATSRTSTLLQRPIDNRRFGQSLMGELLVRP